MTRICRSCNEEKPINQFEVDKRTPTGYTSQCKACRCEARRQNGSYFKERIRKYGYRKGSSVNISVEEIEVLLQKRNCSYCGCELNGERGHSQQATIDHTYGGINLASTLTVACRGCNSAKGNKHVYEFYQSSEKFTNELWGEFVRDFTSKLIARDINADEVEEMKLNFESEFNELGANR